jgi:hypothetical protein
LVISRADLIRSENVRVGHDDVCGKFIENVWSSQKIEWPLHFDFPLDPGEIQRLAQKKVGKLLPKDPTEETTECSGNWRNKSVNNVHGHQMIQHVKLLNHVHLPTLNKRISVSLQHNSIPIFSVVRYQRYRSWN